MPLTCPVEPDLLSEGASESETLERAEKNRDYIEEIVNAPGGGHARIPKGAWPVQPIQMTSSNSRISGCGVGVSELVLWLPNPVQRDSDQHIISTKRNLPSGSYTTGVTVNDLTLNGNQRKMNWSNLAFPEPPIFLKSDGNAFGIWARACRNCAFYNIEIKDCWTDGLYISNAISDRDNNSVECTFQNLIISDCGRQGISVVGAEHVVLQDISIRRIGIADDPDTGYAKSPRAGIDIEPEGGARFVRHIAVSNIIIEDTGQGVLTRGNTAAAPMEDVIFSNIQCNNLDGTQALSGRDTSGLAVRNFSARNLTAPNGLPVIFQNSSGVVHNLSVVNSSSQYCIRVTDDTDMQLNNIRCTECDGGAIFVGEDPPQSPSQTNLVLTNFEFKNLKRRQFFSESPLSEPRPIRVRSAGDVVIRNGIMGELNYALETLDMQTSAKFEACRFDAASGGLYRTDRSGSVIGTTNNWNTQLLELTSIRFESAIQVTSPGVISVLEMARWDGNEIVIRDSSGGASAVNPITVSFPAMQNVYGNNKIETAYGALVVRTDGTSWYLSTLSN